MAERTQLQYQPVTGPVWSEPVASRLAWLPNGQWQPVRALPPNQLGDFSQPAFDSLYNPAGIQWISSDGYAGRLLSRTAFDYSVLVQVVTAAVFDPQNLEWVPSDRYYGRALQSAFQDVSVYPMLVTTPADIVPLYIMIDGFGNMTYGLKA